MSSNSNMPFENNTISKIIKKLKSGDPPLSSGVAPGTVAFDSCPNMVAVSKAGPLVRRVRAETLFFFRVTTLARHLLKAKSTPKRPPLMTMILKVSGRRIQTSGRDQTGQGIQ
jgi:hypothetical protein